MKFTGTTVEEAIQNGLAALNIPRKKAHITVVAREKKGFLGFGKKPAIVEMDAIQETTITKANQKAVRGVPDAINELNEPVKSVSEATIDLGKVVAAVKEFEKSGQTLDEEIKAQILKNEKDAKTILEETGRIEILSDDLLQQAADKTSDHQEGPSMQDELAATGLPVEASADMEEVIDAVGGYIQEILDDMDVEASTELSYTRRSINVQIDTNEPGRVIGYHGKVLKSLQLLAQNFLYNRYERNFYITINVNDYVEHRAEVLQGYAQKLAERVLLDQEAYHTDPMSSNERKIIHRIISRIDGVTSYSEGSEPRRYVVVDIEGSHD